MKSPAHFFAQQDLARLPKCLLPYKISPELVFGKLPSFRSVPSSLISSLSRQLHSLTSLAMAAPSTGTRLRLVVHNMKITANSSGFLHTLQMFYLCPLGHTTHVQAAVELVQHIFKRHPANGH
ncbi:hypothetical protein AVEN_177771-1 [Araneus ventricosus]|uniref:Uncharacterized protein n=1 Tax=Araneus ventricosus TaxID=182803 RepID=A0A4Y2LJV2_ARAVE|nr:hypothetical protein AVEN_177771-1 [Araneus ventricosus]